MVVWLSSFWLSMINTNISSHHCRYLRWFSCEVMKVSFLWCYIRLISTWWNLLIWLSIDSHLPFSVMYDTLVVAFDLSIGSKVCGVEANSYVAITTGNWRPSKEKWSFSNKKLQHLGNLTPNSRKSCRCRKKGMTRSWLSCLERSTSI